MDKMELVIQRVTSASVVVDSQEVSKIDNGLCILIGFEQGDNKTIIDKVVNKVLKLRIFEDRDNLTNISLNQLLDKGYSILLISQFTLLADTSRGNRPSFTKALDAASSRILYDYALVAFNKYVTTKPGIFQADMKLTLTNDGPFTIVLHERNNK